jgi:hypothetical protein
MRVSKSNPSEPAELDDYIREWAGKGKVYLPAGRLPDDLEYGQPGECFATCLLAAIASNGKYRYCEGVGIFMDEAYVHAWLTDGLFAYDLTWRIELEDRPIAVSAGYKGHELDLEACRRFVMSSRRGGIVPNRELRPRLYKNVLKASNLL